VNSFVELPIEACAMRNPGYGFGIFVTFLLFMHDLVRRRPSFSSPFPMYGSIQEGLTGNARGLSNQESQPLIGRQDSSSSSRLAAPSSCDFLRQQRVIALEVVCLIVLVAGLVAFNTNSKSQEVFGVSRSERVNFEVPFATIDRSDYNSPVSDFLRKHLFHPRLIQQDGTHDFIFPFPTGAFWTNLVLPATADRGLSFPIAVYPYAYKWSDDLLQLSYPVAHRREEPKMIHDYFFPDLTFCILEDTKRRYLQSFDALSVTLQYETGDSSNNYWTIHLVQASPYLTMEYQQTSPVIRAFSIFEDIRCWQTDDSCTEDTNHMTKVIQGLQFVIQSQEGMAWLVIASGPITLVFDQIPKTTIASQEPFSGVLRIAYIPTNPIEPSSTGAHRLVDHAGVYPVSANVRWNFQGRSSTRIGTLEFDYTTKTFDNVKTPPDLLMLALPHHAESLPKEKLLTPKEFDFMYGTIKGTMTPVLGSRWSYDQVLPTLLGIDDGSNPNEALSDPNVRAAIVESLQKDVMVALPTLTENVYGFGKQSARLAQMAHIANALLRHGDVMKEELLDLRNQAMNLLSSALESFLTGNVSDFLVYDANLGGLISFDGLLNSEADFGNGRYNDHHFHYGYLLYACAIMGNLNQTFVERFGDRVDAVYFDVAHNANLDSENGDGIFFPAARHKMWFDGHSFASGLFPFGNGKSQESSSEAVNCYYGAYLWSLVRNGHGDDPESDTSPKTDFARLLLATEIRGAIMYWHMSTKNSAHSNETKASIYPLEFSNNLMVGNIGMLDAICSTWFGTDNLYVHMINFIPVTAVTGDLFSRPFVSEEIAHAFRPVKDIEMAWRGYVISASAIFDPIQAWQDAQDLFSPELDSGLSKSQVLYWIATRPGFDSSQVSQEGETPTDEGSSTRCQQNKACADAGLSGECCPTAEGDFLQCCGVPNSSDKGKSAGENGGSCQQNEACAQAGLFGECCPTAEGTFLECCS
jgi:endo-1,3(4)-beta-glucanase